MKTLLLAGAVTLAPLTAVAQTNGEPPADVRMRLGPLFVNPTLALTNAGRDTNVFNDSKNPQDDFTVTVTPGADLWLRIGPTWLQGNIKEDLVWFQKFETERSANNSLGLKWVVPLNRLIVTPQWAYINTRARPGFEIDARAERTETQYAALVEYRLFTKTFLGVEGRQAKTDFAEGTVLLDGDFVDLHNELNRTSLIATANVRHELTPLTSINLSGSISEDRFQFNPLRDSDSRGIAGTIRFDPAALLKGSVTFGYRDFKPRSPDVPAYQGSTLSANLSYVLLGVTKFDLNAVRDVQYSYDINQPYYLQTGGSGSISQQIFGPIDIVVRGGLQRLEYRTRAGAVVVAPNRVDHSTTYGGGIGYHLGRDTRIGVNVDHSRRESVIDIHQYQGWTYGIAVTYATGSGS